MSQPYLTQKPVVTLELARHLMAAAERAIAEHGWAMYVAIVDEGGTPLLVERVNHAQPASYDISLAKARSASGFRRPTKIWEERVKGGAPNIMTLPGVIASEGGVPLFVDGVVVGAVGISGGTGAEDGVVGQAVVAALAEVL